MIRFSLLSVLLTFTIGMFMNPATRQSQDTQKFREEFHHTYPLPAGGRIRIKNAFGTVRVTAWDRNEVRVDAVKTATTRQILEDAMIKVESNSTEMYIFTKYPELTNNWQARVEYNVTVPRRVAALDAFVGISALYIDGVEGDVTAKAINGALVVHGLTGEAELSNVNGPIEASFERLNKVKNVSLKSVNTRITLTLPPDASAQVSANSLSGRIKNDYGLPVQRGAVSGSVLNGTIGTGDTRITLNNEYGTIQILRAGNKSQ